MINYQQLTENIRNQINPDDIAFVKAFADELGSVSYSDVLTFIRMAMKAVEPEYTKKTKDAGENAKQHLNAELQDKTFRYQGSVMTDTHIKGYSDIDLLVISNKFYTWNSSRVYKILDNLVERNKFSETSIRKLEHEKSLNSYQGNSAEDLRKLRIDSENVLSSRYNICDISKPKAIRIKNQSLNREVDIVIANWYDDVSSIINDKGIYRGLQVYDKLENRVGNPDYPFLSIERINDRSSLTSGRLKRMIRFLKNVKAHSNAKIDISSFDINAICYDIDVAKYSSLPFYELVRVIYEQLYSICKNYHHAEGVTSVDGKEYIFRNDPVKIENLKILLQEVYSIYKDLQTVTIY